MEFLKLIAARLGMNADASEAAIVAALVRLQEEVQSGKAEAKASRDDVQAVLTLSGKPTTAEALGVFQAWKAGADQVGTLSARVTEMERASAQREIDGLIAQGQKDGKLPPSLEAWAKTQSVVSLQAFLAAAVPVVTTAATEKKPPDDKSGIVATLSDEQKKIAANLGVKPEDLAARVAAARA